MGRADAPRPLAFAPCAPHIAYNIMKGPFAWRSPGPLQIGNQLDRILPAWIE